MPESAPVLLQHIARNAARPNPASDGSQLTRTDQRADVILGAIELHGDVVHGQGGGGPVDARSIATLLGARG